MEILKHRKNDFEKNLLKGYAHKKRGAEDRLNL